MKYYMPAIIASSFFAGYNVAKMMVWFNPINLLAAVAFIGLVYILYYASKGSK